MSQRAEDGEEHQALRPFARSLPMSLLKARECVMEEFRPHLNALGITEQQWRILRALDDGQEMSIGELAEQTCISPPSLSRIVPALVSRDLLARRTAPDDGRRAWIKLRAGGRKLMEQGAVRSETIYEQIEERFGAQRMQTLYHLLEMLPETLGKSCPTGGEP